MVLEEGAVVVELWLVTLSPHRQMGSFESSNPFRVLEKGSETQGRNRMGVSKHEMVTEGFCCS